MVTIKEVAQRADVSIATVSYVLNGTGSVGHRKRQAVLEAIKALNYRPSYRGRALQSQRSMTLSVAVPRGARTHAGLGELLAGLVEGAAYQGYQILLTTNRIEPSDADAAIQMFRSGRVDGIILLDPQQDDPRIDEMVAAGAPYICAGRVDDSQPYVMIDGAAGMLEAMAHLIVQGHERIGLLQAPLEQSLAAEQEMGYRDALIEAGIPFLEDLVIESGIDEAAGYTATEELLASPQPPTAIIAGTAALAFGSLHALHDHQLSVGQEIALISFEDTPAAAHTAPPLTAVRQSFHDWGYELAQGLLAVIAGNRSIRKLLQPQLIVRRSCGT
jgi:DNA-binding LacI/PurR family transcriptional regulator